MSHIRFAPPNSVSVTRGRIFHVKNEQVYMIHARFSFLYCFLRLKRRNFCGLNYKVLIGTFFDFQRKKMILKNEIQGNKVQETAALVQSLQVN